MSENFDKLRIQRKFARQSFWSKIGLHFSSAKETGTIWSQTKKKYWLAQILISSGASLLF